MALRIVIGDVTIGIQGQFFLYFSLWDAEAWSLYIRMAKSGCTGLPDRRSGARSRIMTGCGFAFRSAVWSAADRFVRCSRVEARMDGGDCHPAGTGE